MIRASRMSTHVEDVGEVVLGDHGMGGVRRVRVREHRPLVRSRDDCLGALADHGGGLDEQGADELRRTVVSVIASFWEAKVGARGRC